MITQRYYRNKDGSRAIETLSRDAYYRNKEGSRTIETLRWDAYYGNNLMCKIRSRTDRQTETHFEILAQPEVEKI